MDAVTRERIGKYCPPEIFNSQCNYNGKTVDIFAYGMILYCILTFSQPFEGISSENRSNYMKHKEEFDKLFDVFVPAFNNVFIF